MGHIGHMDMELFPANNNTIVPVVLCGGYGERLWPLSRQDHPKQLLKLVNQFSLLQETLLRISNIPNVAPALLICNQAHHTIVLEQIKEINIIDPTILVEPEGKDTAPAITLAALFLAKYYKKIDPLMLVLPADHLIKEQEKFTEACIKAKKISEHSYLVTFGVKPSKAITSYGYLKKGRPFKEFESAYYVDEFVEKPNSDQAEHYLISGDYYWNSGIFMFHCSNYLNATKKYAPSILKVCTEASIYFEENNCQTLKINEQIFKQCPNNSIDYAIMEKINNAAMVFLDADWSDLGSWELLWETNQRDGEGNIKYGDIYTYDVKNSYLHSESRMVGIIGVTDQIVVETSDAVLVADKKHTKHVKRLVDQLKKENRPEFKMHRLVYRPWGFYEILESSEKFKVKRLCLYPNGKLSLQIHKNRSEHWIVIQGIADVIRDTEQFKLYPDQSTYIPATVKHRLINGGNEKLIVIEVQIGNYLGEDDIIRLKDSYER